MIFVLILKESYEYTIMFAQNGVDRKAPTEMGVTQTGEVQTESEEGAVSLSKTLSCPHFPFSHCREQFSKLP